MTQQSVGGVVSALLAACRDEVYPTTTGPDGYSVLVSLGHPGQYQPAAIVAVGMEVRMPVTRPTMGTGRSREQVAEIDSIVSVYVPGGDEAQAAANAAALDLQAALETYLRTSPNERLGGACYDAWVSSAQLRPEIAYQHFDDPAQAPTPTGRVAEVMVTVTARIRY